MNSSAWRFEELVLHSCDAVKQHEEYRHKQKQQNWETEYMDSQDSGLV